MTFLFSGYATIKNSSSRRSWTRSTMKDATELKTLTSVSFKIPFLQGIEHSKVAKRIPTQTMGKQKPLLRSPPKKRKEILQRITMVKADFRSGPNSTANIVT